MAARSDTELFTGHLDRFRRRAAAVMFVRTLVWIAGVTGLIATLTSTVPIGWALATVLVITGAITVARVPSARHTAATLDRVLRLQDRVITAVQCATLDDPFSRLVVRDAVGRLAPVASSTAYPLRIDRAALIAPIVAGLVAAAAGLPQAGWIRTRTSAFTAIAGAPNRSRMQPATQVAEASRTNAPGTVPIREAGNRDSRRTGESPRADALKSEGATASASTTPAGGAQSAEVGGAGATSVTPSEARRAGGVAGGRATARDASTLAPASGVTYTAAYRAARADAEAAIVRDRIPPERRLYVRQYFEAIKPLDQK